LAHLVKDGGSGSGNFGHEGRPGLIGGSGSGGGSNGEESGSEEKESGSEEKESSGAPDQFTVHSVQFTIGRKITRITRRWSFPTRTGSI
jgi:hypothetical protein